MSIVDEITRLTSAKANIKAAIEAKGVSVPSSAHLDAFPSYVSAISAGSGDNLEAEMLMGTLSGTYTNADVTSLRPGAFRHQTQLLSVELPNVSRITGANAFRECYSVQHIALPKLSSIASEGYTFYQCSKLVSMDLPLLTSLPSYAFYECSMLQSVSIPKATTISQYAFNNCYRLSSLYAPEVNTIGSRAFVACSNFDVWDFPKGEYIASSVASGNTHAPTSVYFGGQGVTAQIGAYAFYNCGNLKTFDFPYVRYIYSSALMATGVQSVRFYSLYSIYSYVFARCEDLSVAFLSGGNTNGQLSIGGYAFASCPALESVYWLCSSLGYVGADIFFRTPMTDSSYIGHFGSIYVKASMLSAFQTATNAVRYSSRFVGLTDEEIAALPF